jgi:light-regulated signal transduction histidine kinase (bacteriophytochrome)
MGIGGLPAIMVSSAPAAAETLDLTACDREPIHIPGSIQPHGLLLVADAGTHRVIAGAGDLEGELAAQWLDRDLAELIGQDVDALMAQVAAGPGGTVVGAPVAGLTRHWSVALHRAGDRLLAELEPVNDAPPAAGALLAWLDTIATGFERAGDLIALCGRAATAFRTLTGFDRVMIYRFLDEEAGRVVAEDRDPTLGTFLHHHFPATDIPQQARALYVRNRTRAIPDVGYVPAPLRPAGFAGTDLSDVAVRSVSPIHVRYLKNMGVEASASISIVKDGLLWGLIACHHHSPRLMPRDVRAAAAVLASGLARQIRAKEEAEHYRERLRLRAAEDAVVPRLLASDTLAAVAGAASDDLRSMLGGDGFALVEGGRVTCTGRCPPKEDIVALARWVRRREAGEPVATHHLAAAWPDADAFQAEASGLLALPLIDGGATLMWFRVEQIEEIEWAGNPHKAVEHDPAAILTPRTSFESWSEEVRGRSRRWTLEEVEAAHRLRRAFHDAHQAGETRRLNAALAATLADKDALLAQKDVLMKEVDHRVQNSLQLVSAFLSMQARDAGDPAVAAHLKEAQSRLSAVALVHRRLYSDDQIETVDLSRYLDELIADLKVSLGTAWASAMRTDIAPVLIPTDRAVSLGLVMTELVINATKYAYGGAAGRIDIALEQHRGRLRLIVADEGRGKAGKGDGAGFGSRMLGAMVQRLGGTLDQLDNDPGLRVVLTAPIEERPR